MIDILLYREVCVQLMNEVNSELADNRCPRKIDNLVMAVREDHMVKSLQNKSGISLCCSFPDAQGTGEQDNEQDTQQGYFFVVEKVSGGQLDSEAQLLHYSTLQRIMIELRSRLLSLNYDCIDIDVSQSAKIEWEYQIFGGCNGLSLGFKFTSL